MKRLVVIATLAAAFAACTPDIPQSTVTHYVTALFDPSVSNVPTPNLLATDPKTGFLAVPLAPGASPAQADFVAFLNSLDGFPEDTPGKALFDGPLLPSTVPSNISATSTIRIVDLTAAAPVAGASAAYSDMPGNFDAKSQISIAPPPTGWPTNHLIGIALIGGASGIQGAPNAPLVGSSAWALVRSSSSLVTCTTLTLPDGGTNPECLPTVSGLPSNQTDPAARVQDQAHTAVQLEMLRLLYQPFLDSLAAQGVPRDSVALAWTFKVTSRPQVPFDPANNVIPFPNDILRPPLPDGGTPHVSLPLPPLLPDGGISDTGQLYMGLNTLDGFSTTAPIVSVFNADNVGSLNQGTINQFSLTLGAGWGFSRLAGTPSHPMTAPSVTACLDCADSTLPDGGIPTDGGIPSHPQRLQFVPNVPLDERTTYGVYITTNVTDTQFRKVIPSSAFALLRSANPLYDGTKSTVDLITDDQARQLEQLRVALKPFIDVVAAGVGGRSNIALAWAFTTQSELTTLKSLRLVPQGLPAATANPLFAEDATALLRPQCPGNCPNVSYFVIGEISVAFLLTGPGGVFNPSAPSIKTIPFLLTLPTMAPPSSGYPVVVFGHGLTRARTDMLSIADRLAFSGIASIATDVVFHGDRTICTGSHVVLPPGATDDAACANPTTQMCAASGRCIARDRTSVAACSFGTPTADQTCLNLGQGLCYSDSKCEGGDFLRDPTNVPRISGWNILNLTNQFATRDNFRQQVVDLSQLTRVIAATGNGSLNSFLSTLAPPPGKPLDPMHINYTGQSLGGILGTLYSSVATEVHRTVLNVPGGDPTEILLTSPAFATQRAALLATLAGEGITQGSIAFDTFIGISKWIIDPADPQNMSFSLMNGTGLPGDRKALVQYITQDQVVPNPTTVELINGANRTGFSRVDTCLFMPSTDPAPTGLPLAARHGFLLNFTNMTVTAAAQTQVADYVNTGMISSCP